MFVSGKHAFMLGKGITYCSILPMVTEIVVLTLHRILYHTKVQNLVISWILKLSYIFLIDSSIFEISTSE